MKKTSKIFGTIALSAALAMGCMVPAFANPADGVDGAEITDGKKFDVQGTGGTLTDDDNAASTIVTVSTYTSQVSVTVPLALPFAADTAGGVGVTPTGYFIENNSSLPISITKADYGIHEDATADWTFGGSAFATDAESMRIKGAPNGSATASPKPAKGSFHMVLTPAFNDADGNPVTGAVALNLAAQFNGADPEADSVTSAMTQGIGGTTSKPVMNALSQDLGWTIQPDEQADITVAATTSRLDGTIAEGTNENVASIIYTVALA